MCTYRPGTQAGVFPLQPEGFQIDFFARFSCVPQLFRCRSNGAGIVVQLLVKAMGHLFGPMGHPLVGPEIGKIPHVEIIPLDGTHIVEGRCLSLIKPDAFPRQQTGNPVHGIGGTICRRGAQQAVAAQ